MNLNIPQTIKYTSLLRLEQMRSLPDESIVLGLETKAITASTNIVNITSEDHCRMSCIGELDKYEAMLTCRCEKYYHKHLCTHCDKKEHAIGVFKRFMPLKISLSYDKFKHMETNLEFPFNQISDAYLKTLKTVAQLPPISGAMMELSTIERILDDLLVFENE